MRFIPYFVFSVNRLTITAILQMCIYSYTKYDPPQRRNGREWLDPRALAGEGRRRGFVAPTPTPTVAPAQAGTYRACRPSQTHVIATSLRWCDGVFAERVGEGEGAFVAGTSRICELVWIWWAGAKGGGEGLTT